MTKRKIQIKAKIVFNEQFMPGYFHLGLEAPAIAREVKPGQFIHIRISDGVEPLLRRPFSIHRIRNQKPDYRNQIEILYKVVGRGTEILSQKRNGEYLDVIGPLGNGFSILDSRYSILVAGGMGVAPLVFLAEKTSIQYPASSISVLIGAKTKNYILCDDEFRKLGCDVKIATDDGSRGFKGSAAGLLKKRVSSIQYPVSSIYTCGPHEMLKEVASIAHKNRIPCQASLEEFFACGVGACLGCAVRVKTSDEGRGTRDEGREAIDQYKLVCKDGPVFDSYEILW